MLSSEKFRNHISDIFLGLFQASCFSMSLGDTDGDVLERAEVRSAEVTPLIAIWDIFVIMK